MSVERGTASAGMRRRCRGLAEVAVLMVGLATAGPSAAGPAPGSSPDPAPGTVLLDHLARVDRRLEQASEERLPPLMPPVPITVKWRARRISSIGLGAPLLAVASGDIDGDAGAELIALTTDEVVVLQSTGRRTLAVIARAPLPPGLSAIGPRDPVGALVIADVDGDGVADIAARSSTRAVGVELRWSGGALAELRQVPGFPLCAGVSGELDPGRNYYDAAAVTWTGGPPPPLPERVLALRCRADLVDPAGRPLRVIAAVGVDGTLALRSQRSCRSTDQACLDQPVFTQSLADNGYALEVADVDHDGNPEVIVTAAAPPGDGDRLTVLTWRHGRLRRAFARKFSGGVVAITAGDLDGDGASTVIAAVRLPGSTRIDLWKFN